MKGKNKWLLFLVAILLSSITQAQIKVDRYNQLRARVLKEESQRQQRIKEFLEDNKAY